MKILFCLENYLPHIGGVEVVFKNLSEGLAELGHDISIVTHRLKGTKKFEIINRVKIYRVNCFYSRYFFTFLSIPKVIKLAKDSDIIHTTSFNGAPPAWLASKITKTPCIITVHEVWIGKWQQLTEMGKYKAKVHDLLEKLIYFLNYDKYVCVSYSTKKQLLGVGTKKDKVSLIYNGVDYEHFDPKKYNENEKRKKLKLTDNFVYLFTGRPGISKGLEYLIKAVPQICTKIKNAKLLAIVSRDKTYEKKYNYIMSLIKKLDISECVKVINSVPHKELPAYIKSADCVVVPSLAEGFGFAAAEACAMKIPVVAANTTSLPEVVCGKYILVKTKDSGSIADAVIKVYKKKYNTSRLKKFELSANIKGYEKVYRELIKN